MKLTHDSKTVFVTLRNGNSTEVLCVKDVLDIQNLPQEKVIIIIKKDKTFFTISTELIIDLEVTHYYGYTFNEVKNPQEKEVKA